MFSTCLHCSIYLSSPGDSCSPLASPVDLPWAPPLILHNYSYLEEDLQPYPTLPLQCLSWRQQLALQTTLLLNPPPQAQPWLAHRLAQYHHPMPCLWWRMFRLLPSLPPKDRQPWHLSPMWYLQLEVYLSQDGEFPLRKPRYQSCRLWVRSLPTTLQGFKMMALLPRSICLSVNLCLSILCLLS